MSFKSNIDSAFRTIFYANTGKEEWDGGSEELPKPSPQSSFTLAATLNPTVGNTVRIREAQGGVYNGDVVGEDSVLFDGPQTALFATGSTGLTASSNASFKVQAAISLEPGGDTVLIEDVVAYGLYVDSARALGDGGVIFNIKGVVDDVFIDSSQLVVGDNGTAIYCSAETDTAIDINCHTCVLDGDNATFIKMDQPNFSDIVSLEISTMGSPGANPTAINMMPTNKGNLVGYCQILAGDVLCEGGGIAVDSLSVNGDITIRDGTFATLKSIGVLQGDITVDAGGTLNIIVNNHLSGTVINNGTINGIINGVRYGNWIIADDLNGMLTSQNTDQVLISDNTGNVLFTG